MSTSNNSLSSLITVATFTGQSKYSADFQQVLTRAAQLQSLNLQSLVSKQQSETDRQSALSALDTRFGYIQNAMSSLATASSTNSYTGTVSNPSVAAVSVAGGAQTGSYTLEVKSLGAKTQVISSGSVSDPNATNLSTGPFALSVGGGPAVQITPTTNTLQGLANAINQNSALGVTATIVNVGDSGHPEYHLSLQAKDLGNVSVELSEGTVDMNGTVTPGTPLMDPLVTGSLATYSVNGITRTISSNSTTITLAPGVSVDMLQTNVGSPVNITVGRNTTAIQTALQTIAAAYNATVDQVNASYGSGANALQGDGILVSAKAALRAITSYQGSNGQGLSYVGLDLDSSGHLTFNASEFQNALNESPNAIADFLGDVSRGFIYTARSALDGLLAPGSGDIKSEEDQIGKTISALNDKISSEVDRINTFQQNLMTQLSRSDAAIYQLESQATFFEGLFNYNNKKDS